MHANGLRQIGKCYTKMLSLRIFLWYHMMMIIDEQFTINQSMKKYWGPWLLKLQKYTQWVIIGVQTLTRDYGQGSSSNISLSVQCSVETYATWIINMGHTWKRVLVSLTEVYRIQSNIYLTNLFRRGKKHTKRLLFEFNAALSLQMAFELFWKYAYVLSPLNLKASCQLLDNFPACMSKMIIRMKILPLLVFMSNLQCSNLSIVFAIRNSITPKLVTFGTDQKILG